MKIVVQIFIFILFLPHLALAEDKPNLIFFGGCGGGSTLIQQFLKDAKASHYDQSFNLEGEPYAAGSVFKPRQAVVNRSSSQIRKYVKRILSHPEQKFILATHSSSSAAVYEIVRQVYAAQKVPHKLDNVEIINIDGFHPPDDFAGKVKVTCYSANNGRGVTSPNYFSSQPGCETYKHVTYPECRSSGCLHFRLVNSLSKQSSGSYVGARFSFGWMPSPSAQTKTVLTEDNKVETQR